MKKSLKLGVYLHLAASSYQLNEYFFIRFVSSTEHYDM